LVHDNGVTNACINQLFVYIFYNCAGVLFSEFCEAHRSNPRRGMVQLQSSGEAKAAPATSQLGVAKAAPATAHLGVAPAPSPMV
jgi:hypothetical protein